MYIDVGSQSIADVFLSNSPTLAGVTQKFLLRPTSWASTGIAATDATNIPSGYRYAYVTNTSGETNSSGAPVSGL
jgi:hypothetical protein